MDNFTKKSSGILDYLNPFFVGASMVFNSLFNIELRRKEVTVSKELEFSEAILIKISFSGSVSGVVFYGFDLDVAFRIAEAISPGMSQNNFKKEYLDIMGEIGNIIAGNAVSMIMDEEVNLSLPEVISKSDYKKEKSDAGMIYMIPLICPFGYITIYVSFSQ
jgi:CheY-specific phosphatase CheX